MEHRAIEDDSVVERYVTGALPAEERIAFEEHLVECVHCQEQVEWTEDFRGALRQVATEAVARPAPPRRAALLPRVWLPLAASVAVAALGLSAWTLHESGRVQSEARDWKGRYDAERAAVVATQRELVSALEKARASATGGVVAILLSAVRDAQGAEAARLVVPAGASWIVLSLEAEPDPAVVRYRAAVRDEKGATVYTAEDVVVSRSSMASVLIPSDRLADGVYVATLSAERADGRAAPIGVYRFRLERAKHP